MQFKAQPVLLVCIFLPANAILRPYCKVYASCGDSTKSQQYCEAIVHPWRQWKGCLIIALHAHKL